MSACGALLLAEPRALLALALALPVVAAHLWRRRRQRLVVAFSPLLAEALGAARGAGGWRRLAEGGALACRLLALAALALAWAGPRAEGGASPRALALVVDAAPTTGALEGDGRTRLAHAFELAAAHVRAHAHGPVSVVVADDPPRVLAQAREDRAALAGELLRVPARPGRDRVDLAPALALARGLAGPEGLVRLFSARETDGDAGAGAVDVVGVGSTAQNQGIVGLSLSRAEEGPRLEATVHVRNESADPVERRVLARVGTGPVEARVLTLAGGAEAEARFPLLAPPGGAAAELALEGGDAFPEDDRVQLVLPAPHRPSVLAVHDGRGLRPTTAALLAALGESLDAGASGAVAAADLASAAPRDVTLVDGAALPPGALRPGAWLFLAPLAGELPFGVGPPLAQPLVWRVIEGHPLLRGLSLTGAAVERAWPIRSGPGVAGLAFSGDESPLVAEGAQGALRWIALGLDPEGGALPVSAALPLLVRGALERLSRAPVSPLPPLALAGSRLRALVPLPGGPRARLRWEGGEDEADLSPEGPGWTVPAAAAGVLHVEAGPQPGGFRGRVGVAVVDPGRRVAPARPPGAAPPPVREAEPVGHDLRLLLVGLAALLLTLDLVLLRGRGRLPPS